MENLNRLLNILKFKIIFLTETELKEKNNSVKTFSPDYILEKFNHFIGFEPTKNVLISYFEEESVYFKINDYIDVWGNLEDKKILNSLYFINKSVDVHPFTLIRDFENCIGDFNNVSIEKKKGVHMVIDKWIDAYQIMYRRPLNLIQFSDENNIKRIKQYKENEIE